MKKWFAFLLMFFLAACTTAPQPALPTADNNPAPSAYPMTTEVLAVTNTPYPMDLPTDSAGVQPTVDSTKGQVFGSLTVAGKAVNNYPLYLAEVLKDDKGNEIVVKFSRDTSIPAQVDPDGKFLFVNVPPGRYGFVVDRIKDTVLLTTPGTDLTLLITVLEGQSLNLGDLVYEQMPTNNP